jgi:hypothetical protein
MSAWNRRVPIILIGAFTIVGGVVATTGTSIAAPIWSSPAPPALFVAPSGVPSTSGSGGSCRNPEDHTIDAAVAAAPDGSTVIVCPGVYNESVTVTGKSLILIGDRATIQVPNSSEHNSEGVVFMGPATAGSILRGFTISGAQAEGFYADGTSDLTIHRNRIIGDDLVCQNLADASTGNDCGEGLHLDAVTNSRITGNYLAGNTGGILMTDGIPPGSIGAQAFGFTTEYSGPSSGNLITGNTALDNVWACGITLPSHNSNAVSPAGIPQPAQGGVFDNTIVHNVSIGNGTLGAGAGILIAAPFPGTASYGNMVLSNVVEGNGLAGITVHSHAPDQDVNGNQIIGNLVATNAVAGGVNGAPGDSDFGAVGTIGILVASVTPVSGTVIVGNVIRKNDTGIWTTNNVAGNFNDNIFVKDEVQVSNTNP